MIASGYAQFGASTPQPWRRWGLRAAQRRIHRPISAAPKTHDIALKSHDIVAVTHDNALKSYDIVAVTHVNALKSHDIVAVTHDNVLKSHDIVAVTHDNALKSYDIVAVTHDIVAESYDLASKSPDIVLNSHAFVRMSSGMARMPRTAPELRVAAGLPAEGRLRAAQSSWSLSAEASA